MEGYHLELSKTKRYINLSNSSKLVVTVNVGIMQGVFLYEEGDSIPICINGLKISEGKIIKTNLLSTEIGILLNNVNDGFVPEFEFCNSEYKTLPCAVDYKIIKSHVSNLLDYEGFPYVKLNVKWKHQKGV